jgi:quercetin dioxygenase-like cupin family protein
MKLQKFRWSKVYESSEEELTDFLHARGITAERWHADELQKIEPKHADNDTTIWCAEGSLTIRVDGTAFSIQPGDALPIPSGALYEADAGISGCVCYQT